MKLNLLILLVFLLGFNLKSMANDKKLKVVTMNIHCLEDNWKERITLILNEIIKISPDVISFQEVCEDTQTSDSAIDFIKQYLIKSNYPVNTYEYQYTHMAWDRYKEYILMISKQKTKSISKGNLPPSLLQRGFVALKLQETWFINTHLEYRNIDSEVRKEQIDFLTKMFSSYPNIIMGDFNSSPQSKEHSPFHSNNYTPIFPGQTFNGKTNGEVIIDGLWLSPLLKGRIDKIKGNIILDELISGNYLSDHFGVLFQADLHQL